MKENLIQEKTFQFAVKVVDLCSKLRTHNEHVISKQLLRAGTSIGANVEEALATESKADFIHKMSIASKEKKLGKHIIGFV
jgi:four helix bundle protein